MNDKYIEMQERWIPGEEDPDNIFNLYSFVTEWGGQILQTAQDAMEEKTRQIDQYETGGTYFLEALGNIADECRTISGITMAIADFSDQISWENGYLMQRADLICELLKAVARSGGGGGGGSSMLVAGIAMATLAVTALMAAPIAGVTLTSGIVEATATAGFSMGAVMDCILQMMEPSEDKAIREAEERAKGNTPEIPYSGAYARDDQFSRMADAFSEQNQADNSAPELSWFEETLYRNAIFRANKISLSLGESMGNYLHDIIKENSSQGKTVSDVVQGTGTYSAASMPVGNFLSSQQYQENLMQTAGYCSELNEIKTKQEILLKLQIESAPRGVVQPIINMHGLEIHKEVDAQEVMDRIAQCLADAMASQPARPVGTTYRL